MQVTSFVMLVLSSRLVAHQTMLWYVASKGHRVVSFLVYHTGEAHNILDRIIVRIRCQAIWVLRPFHQCQRKRSEPIAALLVDAAHRVYGMNVSDLSRLIPQYLMLQVGAITWQLIESCGSLVRLIILWWLALGRQCSISDFGGEKWRPRCLPYSV
jgi:hypothetical protein